MTFGHRRRGPPLKPGQVLARVLGAALLVAAAAALVTSFTAANTVPPTRAGVTVQPVAPGEFPPTSIISFPTSAGAYGNSAWNAGCASAICGTAHDSAGGTNLLVVKVSILGPGGHYWNGTDFNTATSEQKLSATGTGTWTLPLPTSSFSTSGGGQGSYTVKSYATDGLGNIQAPAGTATFTIDTTPPANSLTLTGQSPAGSSYQAGTTIYYRGTGGGAGGSFRLRNAVSDGGSGAASSTTVALGGTSTGWTHTPSTVSTPAGGPYDSNAFSWTEGTASSPAEVATAADAAGNTASATAMTFANDATAPSGGLLLVNGVAASAVGSSSWSASGSFSLGRTDYSDAGSGLASSILTIRSATLGAGTCGAAGSGGAYTTATVITGTTNPAIASGFCYAYVLTGADRVGNSAGVATTVSVDASGPSVPVLTLSGATGNTFLSGSTVYIGAAAGKSGGFSVAATSTDSESGISKVNFPALSGFSSGGGDDGVSPYSSAYSWSGAVGAGGAQTVTATDQAALTSASTFTVTADTAAPVTGALVVNGSAASAVGSASWSSSGNFTIVRTDYTDSGSGLASSVLTRQTGTLSSGNGIAAGSCTGLGATTTVTGSPTQSLSGPACYLFTLTGTDNVGNAVSLSTTASVDTSGPSVPALTVSSATGNTSVTGSTVYIAALAGKSGGFTVAASSTDNDSGILKLTFPTLTGFTSGGGADSVSPFSTLYAWSGAVGATGAQAVTATDNAGLTSTAAFTVTPDISAPAGGALTVNGQAASAVGTTSSASATSFAIGVRTDFTDVGSGLGSSILTVQSSTLTRMTCGAAGSGGAYTVATAITGKTNPATAAGFCYAYVLTGTDKVGNTASVTTTVRVTPPPDLAAVAHGQGCPAAGCGWAVGKSGTILYSSDGSTFQGEASGTTADLNGVTVPQDNGHVWAVGDNGTILECTVSCQTPSAAVWTQQTSNTTANLNAVAGAGNNMIWAVGAGGVIDFWNGSTWALQQSGKSYDLTGLGGSTTGTGWAVGTAGTILVSTNGTTWTAQAAPSILGSTTYNLEAVTAISASRAWAVGAGGAIITTTNTGATWSELTSPTANALSDIVSTGGAVSGTTPIYAVGAGGVIIVSTNGTTFALQNSPTTNDLNGVDAQSGSTLWAVGQDETILYSSTTGSTWTLGVTPMIGLSPANGSSGATVIITGTNFAASSALSAKFNGTTVTLGGTTTTSAVGAVTGATFVVPGSLNSGSTYQLVLTDAAGNRALAGFTVN